MTRTLTVHHLPFSHPLLANLRPGHKLRCDDGFACMEEGSIREIFEVSGVLVVECANGIHCLDGQLDAEGRVVGMEMVQ